MFDLDYEDIKELDEEIRATCKITIHTLKYFMKSYRNQVCRMK